MPLPDPLTSLCTSPCRPKATHLWPNSSPDIDPATFFLPPIQTIKN
ncbi:hypothetical protein DSUL_30016 [Desulfovibrionales bacterium]